MVGNKMQKLAKSIEYRYVFEALFYIACGKNVATQDNNGLTLLHVLVDELYGNTDFYELQDEEQYIFTAGLDPLILPENNRINLIDAIRYLVIKKEAKLIQDIHGETPLHWAAKSAYENLTLEQTRLIITLLCTGQDYEQINVRSKKGVSAWMLSVINNVPQSSIFVEMQCIEINFVLKTAFGEYHLYEKDSRLSEKLERLWGGEGLLPIGFTDLMVACLFENYTVLEKMFLRSDLKLTNDQYIISTGSAAHREVLAGETPFHYAVECEDIKLFIFLLKKLGPDRMMQENSQGHSPLHKAAHVKCSSILQLLLDIRKLRNILEPTWALSDEKYKTFVNRNSMQGMAASCYSIWLCNFNLRTEDDYRSFIRCQLYEVTMCDINGNSLIHILADEGYPKLLEEAAERADVRFDTKNASGHTPLRVALESENSKSPQVIETFAKLAKNRDDINPNTYERYYPNIRKRLETILEESLHDMSIENISVEKLLNVYLTEKPFISHAYFEEETVKIDILGNGLLAQELKTNIEYCLHFYLSYHYEYERSAFCSQYPVLDPSLSPLYETIITAYKNCDYDEPFICKISNIEFRVSIVESTSHPIRRPIEITYNELVEMHMGVEWDYKRVIPRGKCDKATLPKRHIFHFPEIPLMHVLIEKINNTDKLKKMINFKKFWRLLCFPYIENSIIRYSSKNLILLSQYASGSIKEDLEEKFKKQTSGAGIIQTSSIKVKNISYQSFDEIDYNLINILTSGKNSSPSTKENKLYYFLEILCKRMALVINARRYFPSNKKLDILASLAELLELDTTCVAVLFDKRFIISSNFSSNTLSSDTLRIQLNNFTKRVLTYFHNISHRRKNSESAISILVDIASEHLKSVNANKKTKEIINNKLKEVIEYIYFEYKSIENVVIIDEDGELIRDRFVNKFVNAFSFIDKNIDFNKISGILDEVYRVCKNFLILEESILTANLDRKIPNEMFKLIHETSNVLDMYVILPNKDLVHAEIAIFEEMANRKNNSNHKNEYLMGISKICCPHCALFFDSLRHAEKKSFEFYIYTKGVHKMHFDWKIPRLFFDKSEFFSLFLGGAQSELHQKFLDFDDEYKFFALTCIQNISSISSKEINKKPVFTELRNILNRGAHFHLRAPHMMLGIDASVSNQWALANLEKVVDEYAATSKKVRFGLFIGQLPRNLREIYMELSNIKLQSYPIKQGLRNIIHIAENMGRAHPILQAAQKCFSYIQMEPHKPSVKRITI